MVLRPISESTLPRNRLRTQALRDTWHLALVEHLECLKRDPAPEGTLWVLPILELYPGFSLYLNLDGRQTIHQRSLK